MELSEGYFAADQGPQQAIDIMRCLTNDKRSRSNSFLVTGHNEVESLLAMAEKYFAAAADTHVICHFAIAALSSNCSRAVKAVPSLNRVSMLDSSTTRDRLHSLLDTMLSSPKIQKYPDVWNSALSLYSSTIDISVPDRSAKANFVSDALMTYEGSLSRVGVVLSAISDAALSDLIDLSDKIGFVNIVKALVTFVGRYISNSCSSDFISIEKILVRSLERVIIICISCLGDEISTAVSNSNESLASYCLEKLFEILHMLLVSANGVLTSLPARDSSSSMAVEASYLGSLIPLAILNVHSILKDLCKANPELLMVERNWIGDANKHKSGSLCTLRGHSKGVNGIIQLADGRLCSASADMEVRIWNLDMKTSDLVLKAHTNSVGKYSDSNIRVRLNNQYFFRSDCVSDRYR